MIEIADRIFYIETENSGRYPLSHSIYVKDDVSVIIEPACREDLMKELASEAGVDIVLNTHFHEDHRIYNYLFENARLFVHELDAHGYGSVEHFIDCFALSNSPALADYWKAFLFETLKYQPYEVNTTFADGFEIDLGHTKLQVIHTPGHSAGHCCFHFPNERIVYLGDLDLTSFGPWYGGYDCDIEAFLASIERIRDLAPRAVVTSHGHGLITESIDERLQRYADIIGSRDKQILEMLSTPQTLDEILSREIIYRQNQIAPDGPFYWDNRHMIGMHLERLEGQGLIKKDDNYYSVA